MNKFIPLIRDRKNEKCVIASARLLDDLDHAYELLRFNLFLDIES